MYVFSESAVRQIEQGRDVLIVVRDLAANINNSRDIALSADQLVSLVSLIADQISAALLCAQWSPGRSKN